MAALEPEVPPVLAVPAALCGDCINVIGGGVGIGSPLRATRAVVSELRSPDAMSLPVLHLPAGTPLAPQPEPRPLVFPRPTVQRLLELTGLLTRRAMAMDRDSVLKLLVGLAVLERSRVALLSRAYPHWQALRAILLVAARCVLRRLSAAGTYVMVVTSSASRILPSA